MPTPPLTHGKESVDRLAGCARLGVPMVYASAFLPGATAPASVAGCVVLANAEMLSGLVITQLAAPGAPFVYGVSQGWMEPRSGHIVYCGPEEMAAQQGSADLARHYGLPSFGGGGCSDSLLLDEQWAFETGMTLLTAAQSGVTLLHDIGYVASGTGSSYETMVVADELVGWVKAYLDGMTIDEESLAVAEIAAVGPGGTHLGRKYSRRHLRDFFRPRLISQDSFESWQAAGAASLLDRAAERTRELRAAERAYRPVRRCAPRAGPHRRAPHLTIRPAPRATDRPLEDQMTEPRRRSWAEPFKIKMVEPLKMTTREEREVRHPRGRLQHVPAPQRGRLHRPAHRLRHHRDERPPVGRHDAGRRGLRRQPQLLPPRGGGPGDLRLQVPGARRTRAAAPSTCSARR